ncbi:MAG TPA: hypothetical protein VLB79_03250 [Solirubrobacterales bacterium]|nr:hypothetical protein [Solirubrobacterales bacterium]
MRRSITALLALAAVMGAATAGYAALGGADRGTFVRAKVVPSPVRVSGNVRNLFPGVTKPLPIRVRNLTNGPVLLQWVEAIVRRPNGRCGPRYLQTERIVPQQRIPAHGRIDLQMPITLTNEAPDGCQNVIFPLSYRTRVNVLRARR